MSAMDKIKNKRQELVGDARTKIGRATGDRGLQAKGRRDQVSGNLKQAGEKVKDAFR